MRQNARWSAAGSLGRIVALTAIAACSTTPDSMAAGPNSSGSGGSILAGGMGGSSGQAGVGPAGGVGGTGGSGGAPLMDSGAEPLPDAGGSTDVDANTSGGDAAAGTGGGSSDPSCEGGSQVDFALVGWAAENGGTTGGKGGATLTVSDGAALVQALSDQQDSSTPLTIVVSGTITEANSGGASKIDVKDVRDVSIIGAGEGAELNGIGIKIVRASNIVIRNLRIHHVASGDKDAISIEGPADHIWIDHCELYADYQGVDKDFYDGLLDVKGEAQYITYSWNYLHDSWKTSLVGSSEDDTFDRKLTMHHNRYENCNSRLPLFRGGNGHVFNNYYVDIADTGINARLGACLKIEANSFDGAKNPWVSAYSDELGGGDLLCNVLSEDSVFEYADDVRELPSCTSDVPYDYGAVLNHPDHVPAVVMESAGVGKLADPTDF